MDSQTAKLYVSFDADNAGRTVGQAILSDNPEELAQTSRLIQLGNKIFERWAQEYGGICYSSGGDQGLYAVPAEALEDIEEVRKDYEFSTGMTVSVGVGQTLSESGKALLAAKFRGKNGTVRYDNTVEDDILHAKSNLENGTASPEEHKLGEAYLKPEGDEAMKNAEHDHEHEGDDCPYCKEMETGAPAAEEDPCPYCEPAASTEDECPYCAETDDNAVQENDADDDCPYCAEPDQSADISEAGGEAEKTAGPIVQEPTAQSAEAYREKGLTPPEIDKPNTAEEPPIEQGATNNDQPTVNNEMINRQYAMPVDHASVDPLEEQALDEQSSGDQQAEDEHSAEAMKRIAEAIEGKNPEGETEQDSMGMIDDEDLAIGHEMEGNVSRPTGYDEDISNNDMGLSEDEETEDAPDLTEVLSGGLDNHAQEIQKEKVIQLVSSALEGFKASKDVLEKAKEQAPQLYQSSIAMLKAMIEMAKMLGLDGGSEETPATEEDALAQEAEQDPSMNAPKKENEWKEPFPQHPDHGQAPAKEEGPKDPKPKGQLANQ